jgi:nucleotide-binding universal stress UspA family protein
MAARDVCVLIPLDGSPHAEAAIAPAISLVAGIAAGRPAEIHLLRVIDLTTIYGRVGVDANEDRTVHTAITESAREYLSAMAEQVRGQLATTLARGTVSWSVATGIDPAAIIVETAEGRLPRAADTLARAFDVTAMATHGRGGVDLWAVGSVTERVMTACSLPLLVVRPPREHSRGEVPTGVHEAPTLPPLL